jgi:hypothetical protein
MYLVNFFRQYILQLLKITFVLKIFKYIQARTLTPTDAHGHTRVNIKKLERFTRKRIHVYSFDT